MIIHRQMHYPLCHWPTHLFLLKPLKLAGYCDILQVKNIRDMKQLPKEHRNSWWSQDLNPEKADFKSSSFHCGTTKEARDCTSCLFHTQLRAWIPGGCLGQGSPTFSAPGTGFVEDNFHGTGRVRHGFRMVQVH